MLMTNRQFFNLWDQLAERAPGLIQVQDGRQAEPAAMLPPLDLWADEDGAEAILALPGVRPDALEVSVLGTEVTVRGQVPMPERAAGGRWLCREGGLASFARRFEVPFPVAPDEVVARLQDGVLRLKLPRAAASRARRIAVTAGSGAD